ncbi:unnamed protein product, partial [Prorocentrum cordatum]
MSVGAAAPVTAFAVVLFMMAAVGVSSNRPATSPNNGFRNKDICSVISGMKRSVNCCRNWWFGPEFANVLWLASASRPRSDLSLVGWSMRGFSNQQRPPDAGVGRAVPGELAPDRTVHNQKRTNGELIDKVSAMAQRIRTIVQKQRSTAFQPPSEAHNDNKETLQALAVEIADLRGHLDLIPDKCASELAELKAELKPDTTCSKGNTDASLPPQSVDAQNKLNNTKKMVQKHTQNAHMGSNTEHGNSLIDNGSCSGSFPDTDIPLKRVDDMRKLNRITKLMEALGNDKLMGSKADYFDILSTSICTKECLDSFA